MSMNRQEHYGPIPPEKFQFVQRDAAIHDQKLETKARSYLADAFLRFKKNKSSLVAAIVIAVLLLFSVVSPIISPYTVNDKDQLYLSTPPYVRSVAERGWGILDGGVTRTSQNELARNFWRGIATETGYDPVIDVVDTITTYVMYRGQERASTSYTLRNNRYYEIGVVYRVLSYAEFDRIQQWQNETGIQVIYPYVDPADIQGITNNSNIWYQVSDSKGTPVFDENGDFIPAYSTNKAIEGRPYDSLRIPGDDGSYIYSVAKSGAVQCRICFCLVTSLG